MDSSFNLHLIEIMEIKGITAEALAEGLNLPLQQINQYLDGTRIPRQSIILEIAHLLEVDIGCFFGLCEVNSPESLSNTLSVISLPAIAAVKNNHTILARDYYTASFPENDIPDVDVCIQINDKNGLQFGISDGSILFINRSAKLVDGDFVAVAAGSSVRILNVSVSDGIITFFDSCDVYSASSLNVIGKIICYHSLIKKNDE